MADKPGKKSKEYKQFLRIFKLKETPDNFKVFQTYVNTVRTDRRAKSTTKFIPSEGLNNFKTTDAKLRTSGERRDVRYTTEDSFLEIPGGEGASYRASFWVTSVGLGYGSSGVTAQSRMYSSYYAHSLIEEPLKVRGRVPSDEGLATFAEFVRSGQLSMTTGHGLMRLRIPGASIDYSGFIPSFNVDHQAGFPPAPEIEFDFVVANYAGSTHNDVSQQVLAYYLHPSDNYWKEAARDFSDDLYRDIESEFLKNLRKDIRDRINSDVTKYWG